MDADPEAPVFSAVSSSARQLFVLLRCISFGTKVQVQIAEDGLRFSAEESNVMEGMVLLDKSLFSSYHFHPKDPANQDESPDAEDGSLPPFSVSLPSLLAALQAFGGTEPQKPNPWRRDAFSNDAFSAETLGISGICRLRYDAPGSPLVVILDEPQLTTKCELVTYEPAFNSDIPFERDDLAIKIIMSGSNLFDAIAEIATSSPERLRFSANSQQFSVSSSSELGATVIRFHKDAKVPGAPRHQNIINDDSADDGQYEERSLLETFLVSDEPFSQLYKFSHIAATKRALASAVKVSIRADSQGVLSLQFMVENLEGQGVSFVDFTFIPLIKEDLDEDEPDDEEELG